MSDDEADPSLLELLRQSMAGTHSATMVTSDTHVLRDAEYIYTNTIDVAIDMQGTKNAAQLVWHEMQKRQYSTQTWSEHELHPTTKDETTLNFIFTMDLLNFSFWSRLDDQERFAIDYRGRRWTGYQSLLAAINRALDEGIPIATPSLWLEESFNKERLQHVFRSATDEQMPLLDERLDILREAGRVLAEDYNGSVVNLIDAADNSAVKLVNLLARHFDCFRDESTFQSRTVRFMKRASIFVADVWAAFDKQSYGSFTDIDKLTMFADYRVPQMLHTLGCISYSPPLESRIRRLEPIEPGHDWEISIRGCSIWAVELIRRCIVQEHPDAQVNAVLIDFFLYDLAKEREQRGHETMPHHRTRSRWY